WCTDDTELTKAFHLSLTEEQCVSLVLSLISSSLDAWRTRQYDYYQRVLNGILWCTDDTELTKAFHLSLTEEQCVSLVLSLISSSLDAWRTRQYDYYQRVLNGIL
ncbi:hypothetical protein RYX36_029763, partial [Vicia faba]